MNKKVSSRKLPELLAPAGGREGFLGALKAGADAFYLGGEKFGARAYAENFTEAELEQTIREAHLFGKKVYLTVNVLTRESELEDTLEFVERLYREGLDGVIVQDLGVLAGLEERCPGLLLHASTQMSVTGPEAVRYLKKLGVSRVVPARELSLKEIAAMKAEEPIEVEAFIHGAMCYSYSGRCLMSSFLGGRSGNRGRCAGTCRLPYTILGEDGRPLGKDSRKGSEYYPLSMRDMCVLEILPDLIDAGVDSFKIEGRMKKPEYAAGTTAFYRKYIDRYVQWDAAGRRKAWTVDPDDLRALHALYIRSALSTGYYYRRNGRELLTMDRPGYAGADEKLLKEIDSRYLDSVPRRIVCGSAKFVVGEAAEFSVTTGQCTESCTDSSVTVYGAVVQPARSQPMSEGDVEKRLRKTGDTFFHFEQINVKTDGRGFLPVSALNSLRREALSGIEKKILEEYEAGRMLQSCPAVKEMPYVPGLEHEHLKYRKQREKSKSDADRLWAQVMTCGQLQAAMDLRVRHIIIEDTPELLHFMDQQSGTGHEAGIMRGVCHRQGRITGHAGEAGPDVQFYLALPHVCRRSSRERIRNRVCSQNGDIYSGFLVRNIEELVILKEMGYSYEIIADGSLYQWNRRSRDLILGDCDRAVLPWELSAGDLKPLMENDCKSDGTGSSASSCRELLTVYGRLPMMVTAGCVRRTEGACIHSERRFVFLEDRKKAHFPVRCACEHCYNVIYNSLPLSLHNYFARADSKKRAAGEELLRGKTIIEAAGGLLCSFTTESRAETASVLRYFGGQDRSQPPASDFTYGHFRRSAL